MAQPLPATRRGLLATAACSRRAAGPRGGRLPTPPGHHRRALRGGWRHAFRRATPGPPARCQSRPALQHRGDHGRERPHRHGRRGARGPRRAPPGAEPEQHLRHGHALPGHAARHRAGLRAGLPCRQHAHGALRPCGFGFRSLQTWWRRTPRARAAALRLGRHRRHQPTSRSSSSPRGSASASST